MLVGFGNLENGVAAMAHPQTTGLFCNLVKKNCIFLNISVIFAFVCCTFGNLENGSYTPSDNWANPW